MRILAGILATAGLLAWTHGAAAALPRFEPSYPLTVTSSNWSGYSLAAKPRGSYKSVSAQWTQPSADCGAQDAPESYAAIWVGLDGDGSNTVEQTGTVKIDLSPELWPRCYYDSELRCGEPATGGLRNAMGLPKDEELVRRNWHVANMCDCPSCPLRVAIAEALRKYKLAA